ncbi:MerR family transcriptional regulator [Guggenheimella bovis]
MKTIHEVSQLVGVSIRTLQYYDKIGLLHPSEYTEAGYRLYDDTDLERMQQILLLRELEFPLKDIKKIIDHPDFDKAKALEQQIELLILKREHIENLITLAREIKRKGVKRMNFEAFDTKKMDEYRAQAKAYWGDTEAFKEFEEKSKNRSKEEEKNLGMKLMDLFVEFGTLKSQDPSSFEVQEMVKKLQNFISTNYYNCTDEILRGLGKAYGSGGEFTENINKAAGEGTAQFASLAIEIYCKK